MGLTKELVYIGDFFEEAMQLRDSYGKTELYSTGHSILDKYLGGGFGRKDGYEIMLLYGETGIGKSTVGLNLLTDAIMHGKRVGMLVLEDDMADVSVRLSMILGTSDYQAMNEQNNVLCLPRNALTKSWKLDDLLEYIRDWFVKQKVDIIFLDHLQFAFESAEAIKGENEYVAQRVFMQKLNQLVKEVKGTIILVSHVNKGMGKGMNKIVGSGSIAQAATKVIEVFKEKNSGDVIMLRLHKSRFTYTPDFPQAMRLSKTRLEPPR